MAYQAFALKYRPRTLEEVIGQEQPIAQLKAALSQKRVHHAYLLSGPRGVGKTSVARILARCFNCHAGPTAVPCGTCPSCVEIAKGTALDVIEIDAASNRGIDEARSLIEGVKLSPAASRFKVYIIDEVHMMTQDAFNALLKTLEEPPAHVKFIFATTHPHKVLPTILSRCQKFSFQLVPTEKIAAKLQDILSREGVACDTRLVFAVARASGGSIRDAESLLDQLVPVAGTLGTADEIFSFLGIVAEDTLITMVRALVERNLDDVLAYIDAMACQGRDLGIFLVALVEYVRNLILAKISPVCFAHLPDVSPAGKESLLQLKDKIDTQSLLCIIDALLGARQLAAGLNSVRIPLELALIKSIVPLMPEPVSEQPPLPAPAPVGSPVVAPLPVTASQPIVSDTPSKTAALSQAGAGADTFSMDDLGSFDDDAENAPSVPTPLEVDASAHAQPSALEDNILCMQVSQKWQVLMQHIHKTRAAIATYLSLARPYSSTGETLVIAFKRKDYFSKEAVESSKNQKFIEHAVSAVMNKPIYVKFVLVDDARVVTNTHDSIQAPAPAPAPQPQQGAGMPEESSQFINELLDAFGGKIHNEGD